MLPIAVARGDPVAPLRSGGARVRAYPPGPRAGRTTDRQKWRPCELAGSVGAEGVLGHQVAGHPVGAGAASPAMAVHLALPASPAERRAAANVGEQFRGGPEVRETRAAKTPRKYR